MKHLIYAIACMLLLPCCAYKRIGSLTMVSARNVDTSKPYAVVARNVVGVAKVKENDAMEQALNNAVLKHPGGEYMMNVVVYIKDGGRKVKVQGDVWGVPATGVEAAPAVTGSLAMKVGDAVLYAKRNAQGKATTRPVRSVIVAIRNTSATIELPAVGGGTTLREVPLTTLTLIPK